MNNLKIGCPACGEWIGEKYEYEMGEGAVRRLCAGCGFPGRWGSGSREADANWLEDAKQVANAMATARSAATASAAIPPAPSFAPSRDSVGRALDDVRAELERAREEFPPMNSLHEAYAVILEEVDELKEQVWKKRAERDPAKIRAELIQIAAMAVSTILDCEADPRVIRGSGKNTPVAKLRT